MDAADDNNDKKDDGDDDDFDCIFNVCVRDNHMASSSYKKKDRMTMCDK
jgi:hypothetical protein